MRATLDSVIIAAKTVKHNLENSRQEKSLLIFTFSKFSSFLMTQTSFLYHFISVLEKVLQLFF